jgi:tyrosyl-tRNA synthetase
MDLIADLDYRDLIADCTDTDGLRKRLSEGPITLYCGFDPTADSLHVGHLMGQLMLRRFQLAGHKPLPLAGGATGMIGDPSGKSAERNLLTREELEHNVACIKVQLAKLLDFDGPNAAELVDNASWTVPLNYLDFLREVGKHFSVNMMVAKDSVRARLESESGLSYTEFSYMLLQAHDFYWLRREKGCELQVGGSDQWGNITAGTDLIRKKLRAPCFGLTFPLITKADGTKFGKTESGAIWLDPKRTSPYRFFQFFLNSEDRMVPPYLRKFTLLPREAIEPLEATHAERPEARVAHRTLAREVTRLVHGDAALADAERASEILFGGSLDGVEQRVFEDVVGEVPTQPLASGALDGEGLSIIDALVTSGLSPSKGQARRDLDGGGVYVNNVRIGDANARLDPGATLFGRYLLLRKGKKSYAVLVRGD